MSEIIDKEYILVSDAKALLGVSHSYIYDLKDKDILPVMVDLVMGQPRYKVPSKRLLKLLQERESYLKAKVEIEKQKHRHVIGSIDKLRRFIYGNTIA